MKPEQRLKWLKILAIAFGGGVGGGACVWLAQKGSFSLKPGEMEYKDLVSILLSAVSVLVTILGVFIGILAIWGWTQIKKFAEGAAKEHVGEELRVGEIKTHIESLVGKFLETELNAGGLRKLLEERVDHIVYSGAEHRAKDLRKAENEELAADIDHDDD